MMQHVSNYDQPVLALANRHPLLLRDLEAWVRVNPASTRIGGVRREPLAFRHGAHDLLFDWAQPQQVLRRLDEAPSLTAVQFFPEVSGFLHFLTQPAAMECIVHSRWLPLLLLPLQHAPHVQQWLLQTHPRQWPWPLLDRNRFGDDGVAQAALSMGQQMLGYLGQICVRLAEQAAAHYAGRPTPAEILREKQRPLRVLSFALAGSAYQQFCARDIADACAECGAEAQALIPSVGPATNYELLKTIEEFDPDVLVLNGRSRLDYPFLPRELSVLVWDQDYVVCPNHGYVQHMGPRDRLMVLMKEWRQDALGAGVPVHRLMHLNLGANPRLYYPPAAPKPPDCDVLFVGNVYRFEVYRSAINFASLDPTTQQLMFRGRDRLYEWIAAQDEQEPYVLPDLDLFLRQCLADIGMAHAGSPDHWRFLVQYFRYRIAHMVVREAYVTALTEFRLRVYGRGWDGFPAVARFAQPEIANGASLRDAIHQAAINLHLHTWTVHHPRLYDTAAAGGFLLVGRVQEENPVSASFEPGAELDTFGSIAELKRKIRYYLDHPDERQAMAARAAQRVGAQHTMRHRMAEAIEFLAEDTDANPC